MKKPYLILVDGRLWDRKLTKAGALKVIESLRSKGLCAVLAVEQEGLTYEPTKY